MFTRFHLSVVFARVAIFLNAQGTLVWVCLGDVRFHEHYSRFGRDLIVVLLRRGRTHAEVYCSFDVKRWSCMSVRSGSPLLLCFPLLDIAVCVYLVSKNGV